MYKFDTCSLYQNTNKTVCYLPFHVFPHEDRSSTTPFYMNRKVPPTVIRMYHNF